MENEKKTSGWKIFFYLTPLYIILGYPLYNWHQKINSGDINISEDDYSAFASDEGEIKKTSSSELYTPDLNDVGYSVNYKSGGESPDEGKSRHTYERRETKPKKTNKATNRSARKNTKKKRQLHDAGKESIRDRETQYMGKKTGFLTSAVGKAMNNPKVVKGLFNNILVVKGFMGRAKVKEVLSSPDALVNYIKNTPAAGNFLNNSIVKKALNNPAIVQAIASSKLAATLLSSPAVKGLLEDSDKMNEILSSNPELMNLLTNPNIMSALSQNPAAAAALANINLK